MTIPPMRPRPPGERRSPEQLWEQYQIEKALAAQLRTAPRSDRRTLYSSVYDELFRRVPHHPQHFKKAAPTERASRIATQLQLLDRFLTRDTTFLEIGAGDCALSLAIAGRVKKACALDVSAEISATEETPPNFKLILSDGTSIPVPPGSVDVAYSNQLMEHLHPDDALEQLRNIYDALAPGGLYLCLTPNRLTGPHDISRYFDEEATGLHLKEYTTRELVALFRKIGFKRVHQYLRYHGTYVRAPSATIRGVEAAITVLPARMRRAIAAYAPARAMLDVRMAAVK